MTWAKVDDGLHDHPKVDAMLEADELRGAAALGLWVAALSFSADQLTDGEITRRAVQRLLPERGVSLAALLVEHALWEVTEAGWRIRGFLDCNPAGEDVRRRRQADAERKAADRARRASKRTSKRTSGATSNGTSNGTSERCPRGRPDTPSRPVPSRPDPESGSPAVDGRGPAPAAAPTRTTSPSETVEPTPGDLAEHVRGILQRGIDGLTSDAPAKAPTVGAIRGVLAKHEPSGDAAVAAAIDARSIAQSQDRAPNIVALYGQRLEQAMRPARKAAG